MEGLVGGRAEIPRATPQSYERGNTCENSSLEIPICEHFDFRITHV